MIECSNLCEVEQDQVVLFFPNYLSFPPLEFVDSASPRGSVSFYRSVSKINC